MQVNIGTFRGARPCSLAIDPARCPQEYLVTTPLPWLLDTNCSMHSKQALRLSVSQS